MSEQERMNHANADRTLHTSNTTIQQTLTTIYTYLMLKLETKTVLCVFACAYLHVGLC